MVYLAELWLPIVLSAVGAFAVSSLAHMVLGYHKSDYAGLPGEANIGAAIRSANVKPGDYVMPYCADMKEMSSPEMQEKFKQGPVAFLTVLPNGPINMGKSLGQWFVLCLVVAIAVAYVTGRTLPAGSEYLAVFRIAGTTAFLSHAMAHPAASIWKGEKWSSTFKHMFDGLLYGLVTGGVFGWLWP